MTPQLDAIAAHIAEKPGATIDRAGRTKHVTLHKVAGKMFAILAAGKDPHVIVKADAHLIDILKAQYDGIGHKSHLDRRFWIAVSLDSDVPADEAKRLIDGSYDRIVAGLTRKQREALAAG